MCDPHCAEHVNRLDKAFFPRVADAASRLAAAPQSLSATRYRTVVLSYENTCSTAPFDVVGNGLGRWCYNCSTPNRARFSASQPGSPLAARRGYKYALSCSGSLSTYCRPSRDCDQGRTRMYNSHEAKMDVLSLQTGTRNDVPRHSSNGISLQTLHLQPDENKLNSKYQ